MLFAVTLLFLVVDSIHDLSHRIHYHFDSRSFSMSFYFEFKGKCHTFRKYLKHRIFPDTLVFIVCYDWSSLYTYDMINLSSEKGKVISHKDMI